MYPSGRAATFFYTASPHATVAEDGATVCVVFGRVRVGDVSLSAEDIIQQEWITPLGVQPEAIGGNAVVICFSKCAPRCLVYRNMLAVPQFNYMTDGGNFLGAENLGLLIGLLDMPQPSEEALLLHMMFRYTPGAQSYVRDVYRLLPGEALTWDGGKLRIDLRRDLRALFDPDDQHPVNLATVRGFFEQVKALLCAYVDDAAHGAATLLSGGVDSTLMQAAINGCSSAARPFPTFSFALQTPAFLGEIDYAREAALVLDTDHTFVSVSPEEYADLVVQTTEILGHPVSHEWLPCTPRLLAHVAAHRGEIRYLFNAGAADGAHGLQLSLETGRAMRYRYWPVSLLRLAGVVLAPILQSKSYGARVAADTLSALRDIESPRHPMNALSLFTDWELVRRCFGSAAVRQALARRRELQIRYLDSDFLLEQVHAMDLVTDAVDAAGAWRQIGLFYGNEVIFPYADEVLLRASFSFDPRQRFYLKGRTKPVLKMALEAETNSEVSRKPKCGGGFETDLMGWMRDGVLHEMVRAIERPAFMECADFEQKVKQPDWFTWNLLTLDIFNKRVLARASAG
ncbi:MAG: asparagine synthase C-terminal domain-containing protein [Anaerolineae bacterium]|nr:asparagine synthase C-terminal domain-containing protein [Anaerolineae bacterium]